ncbi:MAG: hypothetical protein KTR29_04390 [Rhodothermaceae bacterium]|nr:hypothetical protein [Rhodothermaceae bacterium]
MNLWCIHGNLQLPSVWNRFDGTLYRSSLVKEKEPLVLHKESLWTQQTYSLDGWASSFLEKVYQKKAPDKPWIMGYSLGGRLALHAVLQQPDLWGGAIVVAAHPGLSDPAQRQAQLKWDEGWAKRFEDEPWEELLQEWDQLSVFGGLRSTIKRNENEFSRGVIARLFTGFSKANQADLTPQLAALKKPPVLYVTGQLDSKYTEIGSTLAAQNPLIQHISIPNACHRVPWENTAEFVKTIQYFINTVHSDN